MSDQVSVEVLAGSNRTSVEIIEQQGTRIVEVTAPEVVPVVEVLVPGPQGPTGPSGASTGSLGDLVDVDTAQRTDGSVLYYDANRSQFVADAIETKINLTDGGNF